MQEGRGRRGVDAHRVLPRPGHSHPRGSPGSSAESTEGSEEARPGPERTSRARSVEAPGTDAEKLSASPVDWSHTDELSRVKKGGQQVPLVKAEAKGRSCGRAPTNEGAAVAPDVSLLRLPLRAGYNVGALVCTV